MADTVDRLDIEIQAQAASAVAEVDKLYDALERVANVLNIATGSFTNAKTAIQGTARAMRSMAKINMPNLTTITQQMDALSQAGANGAGLGSSLSGASNAFYVLERSSSDANKSMSAMTPVVKGIETAFKGLMTVTEAVAHSIGSVAGFMVSNFTTIGRAASGLGKVKSLMSGILGPLIGFYGVRSLVTLGKDAVELASDLTEVQNVVDHAFGLEGAKAVEDFVATSKENFGLAELAAKQYSSRFQAMGKSMGITSDMVAKAHDNVRDHMVQAYQDTGDEMGAMALNLTKLTADMASFYNEDQAHVAQALQSVFTGQTRSLRQYGIDLTQVNLQEWAAKQGIDAKIDSMTQAEKAMLRYQYIMAQTSMVQGDFARTADTWANQIRLLKQNFQALGSVIGGVVINVFKPLITWMNNAMSSVIAFAETIANALGKIFGWTIRGTAGGGGGDAGLGDLSGGLEDVGDAADGAGGSLGNANKEAKELKRTLLGFDEINKLNDVSNPSSGSGGSGGGGSGGGGAGGGGGATAGDFTLVQTESIFDKYKSDIDSLYGLGAYINDVLTDTMRKIKWETVYEEARGFGTGLAKFLNGVVDDPKLFKQIGITVAGSINAVLNAKDAFLNEFHFDNLGRSLGAGIMGFFETWDAGLEAKVFYKTVNGIVDTIWAALDEIGPTGFSFIGTKISSCIREALEGIEWEKKVFPAAEEFGTDLASFMNGLFDSKTFEAIGDTIAKLIGAELRTLSAWARKFEWDSFGRSLGAGLRKFFVDSMDWKLAASTFTKLAQGIITSAGEAIDTFASGNGFYVLGRKISSAIRSIPWDTLLASAGRVVWQAFNGAIDTAKGLFSGTPFETALGKIQEICNNLAEELDFETIKSGLQGILDVGMQFGAGFMEGFTGAMGVLADIGVGVLSGIGFAIRVIAEALKKLDPDFVKHLGEAFGIMAASFVGMKLATGVATTISGIVGALSGAGSAAATTAGAVATASGAAAGGTITFGKFAASLLTSTGFMEGGLIGAAILAGQKLQEMEDKGRGGNGMLSEMGGIMGEIGNTFSPKMRNEIFKLTNELEDNNASTEEAATAFANYFNGKHVDPTKIKNAMIGIRGNINTTAQQESLVTQILEKMGSKATSAFGSVESGSGKMSDAFDTIGKKAEGADEKTGKFGIGMAGFVGGIVAQTITMALMGTAYKNIGDKATEAQSPIEGLKTKITEMVTSISTNSSTAKKDSGTLADNITDTFVKTIEDAAHIVPSAAETGLVMPVLSTVQDGFGIHSPSTVMRDFGLNIDQGLANGITGSASLVTTALATMLATMKNSMTTFANSTEAIGTTAVTNFKTGLESVAMPDLGKKARDSIDSTYTDKNGSFYKAGRDMANALKSGADSVGGFVNLGAEVKGAMGDYAKSGSDNPFYDLGVKIVKAFNAGLRSQEIAHLGYEKRPYGQIISVGGKKQSADLWVAKWYASGGFPNYGEVYVANEAGPEMIGKFGHKNVVANNQQITDGIKAAVIEGMMAVASAGAFGSSNDSTPLVLNATIKTPDGDVLARVVERAQARRDARYYTTSIR